MDFKDIKLSEITEVITKGTTPTTLGFSFQSTGINFVKIESINGDGTFRYDKLEHISEACNEKLKRSQLKENDILFSIAGAIGKVAVVKKDILPANTNQALAIIRLKDDIVSIPYLSSYLKSNYVFQQFDKKKQGVAQLNLSLKDIGDLTIKIPDKDSQTRIVHILDEAQSLINKRKTQIEALDQLTKSVFLERFGHPLKSDKPKITLKEIAEITMGQSPKGDSYNLDSNGTPLLNGPTEFGDRYPQEKQWTTAPKKLCREGDLLFCVRGATAGRMNVADKEYCIGRGLASIRTHEQKDRPYIYYTLKFLYNHFQQTSNGSTFINIDKKTLENIPVIKADKSTLEKYFMIIERIDEQNNQFKSSLLLLEGNYNSLIQRAFKGELFTQEKLPSA